MSTSSNFIEAAFKSLGKYKFSIALFLLLSIYAVGVQVWVTKELGQYKYLAQNSIPTESDLQAMINTNEASIPILKELMAELNANRALVHLFHNGEKFFTEDHRVKTSAVLEVDDGAEPIIMLTQDLPILFFPKFMKELLEEKFVYIDTVNMYTDFSPATAAMMESSNTKARSSYSMVDNLGRLIGLISVGWTTYTPPDNLSEIKEAMIAVASRLTDSYKPEPR